MKNRPASQERVFYSGDMSERRPDPLCQLGFGHSAGYFLYFNAAAVEMKGGNAANVMLPRQDLFRHGVDRRDFHRAGQFGREFVQHGTKAQAVGSGGSPELDQHRPGG